MQEYKIYFHAIKILVPIYLNDVEFELNKTINFFYKMTENIYR